MGPYVEGLIGQLEEAQDAVSGWAVRVSVARDDAVLMENLEKKNSSLVLSLFDNFVSLFFLLLLRQQKSLKTILTKV